VARSLGINQGHRGRAKRTARAACGGMEERGDASDGLTGRRYAQVCAYHGERIGDGITDDTVALRSSLAACDEVRLKVGRAFLSGPLNLTSNQRLVVDGTLLASQDKRAYPLIAPVLGYGWSNDENCFPPDAAPHKIVIGRLRYAPIVGAFHASNGSSAGLDPQTPLLPSPPRPHRNSHSLTQTSRRIESLLCVLCSERRRQRLH
jgi:hypothetical protein